MITILIVVKIRRETAIIIIMVAIKHVHSCQKYKSITSSTHQFSGLLYAGEFVTFFQSPLSLRFMRVADCTVEAR